jgi:hypothetical protein
MLRFIRISQIYSISFFLMFSSCTNRAPSLRMLDTRAGYENGYDDEEVAIYQRAHAHGNAFARSLGPRIAKVYVYPHELPTQDYFWGGYISLLVAKDDVIYDEPNEDSAVDESNSAPKLPPKHKGKRVLPKTESVEESE